MFYDCDGYCMNDFNDNGVCDELEIYGCMDETAANYNPDANVDNGTCIPAPVMGCVIPLPATTIRTPRLTCPVFVISPACTA